jgi:Concanavalin A-like lectin/glucanases superfamily
MAVRFDQASDRVTWTGTAPTPSSGLTITYWAYVSVDRNDFSTMIRLHTSSGASTVINVATDTSGTLPCVFTGGGSSTGPQALPVADWARVAATVTGSTSRVYVAVGAAGATQHQDGTVGASAGTSPASGYTVGGRSIDDSAEWFDGRIAHLRLWSTVLTQTEIESEWAAATPVRTADLFADYPLSDATDLADHSGNGRHLVAGSTAVTTEDGPPVATTITATLAATLPALAASVAGTATTAGPLAVDLPALTSTAAGGAVVVGQLGAALPALDTELAGGATVTGTVAATLPALAMASGPPKWPPAVTDTPATALVGVSGPNDVPWIAVS